MSITQIGWISEKAKLQGRSFSIYRSVVVHPKKQDKLRVSIGCILCLLILLAFTNK